MILQIGEFGVDWRYISLPCTTVLCLTWRPQVHARVFLPEYFVSEHLLNKTSFFLLIDNIIQRNYMLHISRWALEIGGRESGQNAWSQRSPVRNMTYYNCVELLQKKKKKSVKCFWALIFEAHSLQLSTFRTATDLNWSYHVYRVDKFIYYVYSHYFWLHIFFFF